jgi:HD-GYP domain-containing protein (c-di-GMP phosphodiesterase class II)
MLKSQETADQVQTMKERILEEMKYIFREAEYGVVHTMRVLEHAEAIAKKEALSDELLECISTAAILHDIGAIKALEKYGNMNGSNQELEGPPIVRVILGNVGASATFIDRICYIVGHHHTFEAIDGIDFQILWEADLLENMKVLEVQKDKERLKQFINEHFVTQSGKSRAESLYLETVR